MAVYGLPPLPPPQNIYIWRIAQSHRSYVENKCVKKLIVEIFLTPTPWKKCPPKKLLKTWRDYSDIKITKIFKNASHHVNCFLATAAILF